MGMSSWLTCSLITSIQICRVDRPTSSLKPTNKLRRQLNIWMELKSTAKKLLVRLLLVEPADVGVNQITNSFLFILLSSAG